MIPPGQTATLRKDRVLILAPHFDDETLGCGGLILQLVAQGAQVNVLFLSDGGSAADVRLEEARQACRLLGIGIASSLGLPDGALDRHLATLAEEMGHALATARPQLLLLPSPLEISRDHQATFAALHLLLGRIRPNDPLFELALQLEILTYEINFAQHPDLLVDITAEVPRLAEVMACYPSQQERHDYFGARLGLAGFRTLTVAPGPEAIEAFRRLRLDDFRTHGPSALIELLGGQARRPPIEEGPLVSVIVRTKDRPALLAQALESLARSSYRRLELIIVNDGGATPEVPAGLGLKWRLIEHETSRGRAGAANAGIEAAEGDYIAFLDDDDLVEPEHYATLVTLVGAAGVKVAYTDAAVGVYLLDGELGWRPSERRLTYSRDFDSDLLLLDNYIPFHTLLIEKALVERVGPLDQSLPFFEDWDFLIRLAALTPFHHLPQVTCEYRQFRGTFHHILGDDPRRRADFLATKARVIEKHRDRLGAENLARVIDLLRAETVMEAERVTAERQATEREIERRLGSEVDLFRRNSEIQAALEQKNGELQAALEQKRTLEQIDERAQLTVRRLEEQGAATAREREELRALQQEQSRALAAAYAEIGRLDAQVRALEASRAFRIQRFLGNLRR